MSFAKRPFQGAKFRRTRPLDGLYRRSHLEANTLAGQTKAAFNNALNATKSALHIKP